MDAKQLGTFIAERRKELGLTQAHLAEQLHITDKAVSRWERGVGFPDMGNIEALAKVLDVSLVELMQGRRTEQDQISTQEAEKILVDTIRLSKKESRFSKITGSIILAFFGAFAVMALWTLCSGWETVVFSVGSILTGLIAWGIPVWQLTIARAARSRVPAAVSLGAALLSLVIQFLDIANEVHTGDISAIEDTIDGLVLVVTAFAVITFLLNLAAAKVQKRRSPQKQY